jgi:N-acetyl sugar amidotransferase
MDSTDPLIKFDEGGVCNHCRNYDEKIKNRVLKGKQGKKEIRNIVKKIKQSGKNKKYNCIVGISGGVDSTYVVYLVKNLGLKPLAIHLDNGWNSKTANINIRKILKKLDVDLYTYVINWEEFKDLQLSYLKASVIDIEALTDHAIKAVLYKLANKNNIKYIITGTNLSSEGIMPRSWAHNKGDYKNIIDIHKKFGKIKLKTFPILTFLERVYYQIIKGIETIEILNYTNYDKEKAKKLLIKKFGWEDYGRKHGESVFTKFYQEYILPKKFNVDKRKAHLSALICSGTITRKEALKEMKKPLYKKEELENEKNYVLRKLGLTEKEFKKLMKLPIKSHHKYKSNDKFLRFIRKVYLKISGRRG